MASDEVILDYNNEVEITAKIARIENGTYLIEAIQAVELKTSSFLVYFKSWINAFSFVGWLVSILYVFLLISTLYSVFYSTDSDGIKAMEATSIGPKSLWGISIFYARQFAALHCRASDFA